MATLERTKSFLQARENFSEKNYKEEYEASQREVNILKTKVESYVKKIDDYKISMENKIYLLTEEHKAEKDKFDKLKAEYEGHIASMENILQYQENEQAKLQLCLDETEEDASDYLDQIDGLKKQLEDQSKDIDNLHAENRKLFDMTAQLQDETVRLQGELNESEANLAEHKKQVKAKLAATVDEFTLRMNEGNLKSSQKDETIIQLNEELDRSTAENQHLRINVVTLSEQVASLEALLLEQEKDHLHVKSLYSSHEFAITKLSSEFDSVQQQLDLKSRSTDAAESQVERLRTQLKESTTELAECQERIQSLEAQLKEVQAKSVNDRTNLSNKLLAALDDWNDRIAFVNGQLQQKDELIATQKKQLDTTLSELYNVRQELNKLKNSGSGSALTTPMASPAKHSAGASAQDTPERMVGPQQELSNTWTQLKNQLADYQSTSAVLPSPGVATQFMPPPAPSAAAVVAATSPSPSKAGEYKRSASSKILSSSRGQRSAIPSTSAEEESSPVAAATTAAATAAAASGAAVSPSTPSRTTLNRSASSAGGNLHNTPTSKSAHHLTAAAPSMYRTPSSVMAAAAFGSPATSAAVAVAPASTAASSPTSGSYYSKSSSVDASIPKLLKSQSVILVPRSTSPSRTKSPERTRSTYNLSGSTPGASSESYSAASNYMNRSMSSTVSGDKSPAKLSKSASVGTDRFR